MLRQITPSGISESTDVLPNNISNYEGKRHFLVFKNHKYVIVQTEWIAFFYLRQGSTTIITFKGEQFPVAQSLDCLQALLPATDFFRVNRQYLITFRAIKEVEHYFARKLLVRLIIQTPEELLIRKEKKRAFLGWLDR